MKKLYLNQSGKSGVILYKIHSQFIIVEFKWKVKKKYSYASTGICDILTMIYLADRGVGLHRFINKHKPKPVI